MFATPADEPRARRTSDVILLVSSSLALLVMSAAADPLPGFVRALSRFLASFPGLLGTVWQVLVDWLAVLAVLLITGALIRRRLTIARDLALAAAVAAAVWLLAGRFVTGSWPAWWDALGAADPPPWYPSPRIALPAAVVMTASPHLARPLRRIGRWSMWAAALAITVLGAASPLGAVAGLLGAAIAASAVHLVFGSCGGRPGLGLVRDALFELGVPVGSLGVAARQPAGLFLVDAVDAEGEGLIVKVYGRDAHDSALMSTLWRTVWLREGGSPIRLGRLQQVEHEAFLTLLARQAGIVTDTVVTAGATAEDDALLVLRRDGVLLADAAGEVDSAAVVSQVWDVVDQLHRAGIAHGQIDERHLVVSGDELGVVSFRGAGVAPSEARRRTDEAQALVATVALVGTEPALAAAREHLGPQRLAAVLPYLQPPALSAHQRRWVRANDADLDDLGARAAEVAGTDRPPLQRLRRITLGSLLRVLLPAVAVIALISAFTGLDLAELADQLADATWWLVVLAVLATQVPRVTQAVSTLGASPVPLPLGPVYALQLAVSYVNLAIPTSAARMAVNIRFFQRHGVPPGAALAAGALDGFSGFIVQAAVLGALLSLTPVSLDLQMDGAVSTAGSVLVLVVVIAVVAIGIVVVVPRLRRFVFGWIGRLAREAADALRGINSPRRLAMLFGGNLATEVLFAIALGTFTRALGYPIGLGELLLINISVALLAGLLPVPGGIGVTEGALTVGLVGAGMPEEVAFAAALLYRLSSFYLPPTWGFFALRWLEREQHL